MVLEFHKSNLLLLWSRATLFWKLWSHEQEIFYFMVTRAKVHIPWVGGVLVRGCGQNVVISARCALFPAPSLNRMPHEQQFIFFNATWALPQEQNCCSCGMLMGGTLSTAIKPASGEIWRRHYYFFSWRTLAKSKNTSERCGFIDFHLR